MTLDEAREILKVDIDASHSDVKKQYRRLASRHHPDKGNESDGRMFILINSAYMLLIAEAYGISAVDGVPTEVAETVDIREEINSYLDRILEDFQEYRLLYEEDFIQKIDDLIYSAESKSDLKNVINGSVSRELVELKSSVSSFVKSVRDKLAVDKNQFIYQLFSEMYEDRRRYWILSLWKNPILIFELIGLLSLFSARNSNLVQIEYPQLWDILVSFWAPVTFIGLGIVALIIEYFRLSPRNQFVPPRISLEGLHTLLNEQSGKLGLTDVQTGAIGGASGLFIGTAILPGIGSIVGGAVGYLFGQLFGKDLSDMKSEVSARITSEIRRGFQQVEERIARWVDKSRDELYDAVMESFHKNALRLARLSGTKALPLLEHKNSNKPTDSAP